MQQSRCLKKREAGNCRFLTEICKFSTEGIFMHAQSYNFVFKFLLNGFSAPTFVFLKKIFQQAKIQAVRVAIPLLLLPLCPDADAHNSQAYNSSSRTYQCKKLCTFRPKYRLDLLLNLPFCFSCCLGHVEQYNRCSYMVYSSMNWLNMRCKT